MFHKDTSTSSTNSKVTGKRSWIIYFFISIGVSLQISGANWDIVWHGSRNVESFLTPPHSIIYSGVALAIGSIIYGIKILGNIDNNNVQNVNRKSRYYKIFKLQKISLLPFPIKLAVIGALLQLIAGPFDFWWHSKFGFDGLLSPPHSILAIGMIMAALGGLFGIYNNFKQNISSSFAIKFCLSISFGVVLMVGTGMILMFTLPFSKGQYFDFNPQPFAAIWTEIITIPFVMGLGLFLIASKTKLPFIYTSITTVVIIMQSATTILSNTYFSWLFPIYILNIIPSIIADVTILQYYKKHKNNMYLIYSNKIYIISSIMLSSFFITLFFPWTIDVFNGFFQPSNDLRTEQFFLQLLFPIILPVVIPVSLLSSFAGIYTIQKVNKKIKHKG
jgi:hypothetical protein